MKNLLPRKMNKQLTQKDIVIICQVQKYSSSDSDIIEPVDCYFGTDNITKWNEIEQNEMSILFLTIL